MFHALNLLRRQCLLVPFHPPIYATLVVPWTPFIRGGLCDMHRGTRRGLIFSICYRPCSRPFRAENGLDVGKVHVMMQHLKKRWMIPLRCIESSLNQRSCLENVRSRK